jgi:drug/metabolite transporter (DMT)-like permease
MNVRKNNILSGAQMGAIYVLLFNLLSASKAVFVGNLVQGTHPIVVAFWTFGIAAIFFLILNLRSGRLPLIARQNMKNVALLNISTAGAWVTYFYALKYLEPAIDGALAFAVGPIITVVFWKALRPTKPVLPNEKLASIGILIAVLFLAFTSLTGKSGWQVSTNDSIFGIVCAILSGVCVVGNTVFSKHLSEHRVNALEVMGIRFWLLLLVCVLLWPPGNPPFQLPQSSYISFLIVGFAGIVLPLFILQLGIERSEPITVSLILATLPAISFLLQFLDKRLSTSMLSLLGITGCVFFTALGTKLRLTAPEKHPKNADLH